MTIPLIRAIQCSWEDKLARLLTASSAVEDAVVHEAVEACPSFLYIALNSRKWPIDKELVVDKKSWPSVLWSVEIHCYFIVDQLTRWPAVTSRPK